MKVTILGCGAYGLALSLMLDKNNCDITMWTKFEEEKNMLEKERMNKNKLPNVLIPSRIKFTTNLKDSIEKSQLIIIAVPTSFVGDTVHNIKPFVTNQHFCLASKGIEQGSCLFVDEIFKKHINTDKLAVISGPSFAIDIANNNPIGLALATKNSETEKIVKAALQNEFLKLRTTDDIIGIEICGSVKNIIAIAAGMLAGMNASSSTRAMFITESLHDIKELIDNLGGDKKTILSFAGFGDLLLTCTSEKSRNYQYGILIGSNADNETINNYKNNTTIEGLYTLKSIYKLLNNKKVDMPIIDLVYDIIFKNQSPEELYKFLIEKI